MKRPTFSFRETAPCFFAIFVDILGFGLVYPVLTALFTTSASSILPPHTTQATALLYLSIGFLLYPLFMFFGSSFMGDLSDIFGRKRTLLICMAGLVVGFGLMGIGVARSSIAMLFAGRALSGLMAASMPIALAAISDLSTHEDKAVHMSFVALVQSVGFVLGPFLGGVLSDSSLVPFFNFSIPFFATAFMALIAYFWIEFGFDETFIRNPEKHIDLKRFFRVFVEASKHPSIRLLSIIFLFMQMGIALYLQLILIYFREAFDYSSLEMGLFNAFVGLWFAIGLVSVVPFTTKRYNVERIAFVCLAVTGVAQLLISFVHDQIGLWALAVPLAIAVQVGFTTVLTSFSNAADANSQGWAMGISGSLIAISFVVTGLSPSLVPIVGVKALICAGSLLMLTASGLMWRYSTRKPAARRR